MLRTALLALLPALLIATGWQRLEEPSVSSDFSLAATLAIVTALVPWLWARIAVGIASFIAVVSVGFDLSPFDARPLNGDRDFLGPLLARFGNGVLDFYEVGLPFSSVERPRMHGVIVLAVFAFTLLAALAIAARRPVLAAAATFAGAAWPVTLVPSGPTTARGALLLVAALILLAALRPGARPGGRQALLVGSGVLLAALVAVSSPAVAKGGFLDWEQWEPYSRDAPPVSVRYVWDADYDGIDFPTKPTTLLTIVAPRRAPYWRATTLDVFLDDLWLERAEILEPTPIGRRDILFPDPYLPPQAIESERWMEQLVTVEALQDVHLPAASVPVAYESGSAGDYGSGVAYVGRLHRGQDYRVWSYAPAPTPAELTLSRPNYPDELVFESPFLSVGGGDLFVRPFGTPKREQSIQELFAFDEEAAAYEPLYRLAREVVGRPTNPYAAVVALEAWFRSSDEFRYDESPPVDGSRPPLVAFVDGHKRGYCQHFAGAMALMLRYLGIPARVAAGFTTGRFDEDAGEWTVADTNAHTWVEAWFDGYGWLPFDPTPGRGRLRATYTASSLFFDANGATAAFAGVAAAAIGLDILRDRVESVGNAADDRRRDLDPNPGRDTPAASTTTAEEQDNLRILGILLLAAAVLVAGLWLTKTVRRRARYLTSDPRATASAIRAELVDYLADQGLRTPVSATPAEVSADLWESLRVDGDLLARTLGAARFGPEEDADEAVRIARQELGAVLRSLRRRLGTKERLRGLFSLRSLVYRDVRA